MVEISFSLMGTDAEVQSLVPWMEEFNRLNRISVKIIALDWSGGWETIVKTALQGNVPDISEVGSTWVASLASMNVLRPFSGTDIQLSGGKAAFLESSWNSCIVPDDSRIWAAPWLADAHVVYYWRDALEKAHVTPEFASASQFESTLLALQNAGYPAPIFLATGTASHMMHDAASWVWGEGGEFVDNSGSKVVFAESKALNGFIKYFNLRRFLAPGYRSNQDTWDKFLQGERQVAIGTPFHYFEAMQSNAGDIEKWGATPVLGSSFMGGTNLVVWKNSRQSSAAIDLIRFLQEKSTGFPASPHSSLAPCRVDTLNQIEENGNEIISGIARAIKTGRSYRANRLWGLIEKGLTREIGIIWETLLDDPTRDIEAIVSDPLLSLARRLNLALSG
jgi:multiple sugar transport system substrate-binding protein